MCCCVPLVFFSLFLHVFDLSRSPCFSPHAKYPRTADQDVTPVASTAQLGTTGQFALHKQLLALSNRCSHQNMGLYFLPPLHVFSCILPRLRERSGRHQPPAERSPCNIYGDGYMKL